jgi:hypothetical protein
MDQDKSVDVSMGLRTPNDKNIAQKTKNTLGSTRQGRTPLEYLMCVVICWAPIIFAGQLKLFF